MSLVDFARPRPTFSLGMAFREVAAWLDARWVKRQQEAALQSLLFAPEHRLRDLGISRDQLLTTIEMRRR